MTDTRPRDIVVVGASAGGVETLGRFAAQLPPDLPAAVLVVLHMSASGPSLMPQILNRAGQLFAAQPAQHEPIEHGRILIAPPDHHLTIHPELLAVLSRGPKVNGYRPSIDELFRSAAENAPHRVVGVVLSGALDDGSAGLATIARAGGVALVQDPETALHPSMPRAALAAVPDARALGVDEIAAEVARLAERARESILIHRPEAPMTTNGSEKGQDAVEHGDDRDGVMTGFTCPECSGTLWEHEEGEVVRFQCRVGHAYSTETLVAAQEAALEAGLWAAARALYEKAAVSTRLSLRFERSGHRKSATRFRQEAEEARRHADELRRLIEVALSAPADERLSGV